MTGLVEQLEEIRARAGLAPLPDPRVIEGPPYVPHPLPGDFGEPTVTDQDGFEEPVSPLVAAARPTPEAPAPTVELAIIDSNAAYQGHTVHLSDSERRAVTGIVLRALQRVVKEQLRSLVRMTPKRPRKARAAVSAPPTEPPVTPKRRGRPRGSLLGKS